MQLSVGRQIIHKRCIMLEGLSCRDVPGRSESLCQRDLREEVVELVSPAIGFIFMRSLIAIGKTEWGPVNEPQSTVLEAVTNVEDTLDDGKQNSSECNDNGMFRGQSGWLIGNGCSYILSVVL